MASATHIEKSVPAPLSANLLRSFIYSLWAFSLLLGQVGRVPVFGQSGGILLSDVANVLMLTYAIVASFRAPTRNLRLWSRVGGTTWELAVITPFLIWSLFVLLIHSSALSLSEMLVSLSYWLRLFGILALVPAFQLLTRYEEDVRWMKRVVLWLAIALPLVGYLQLFFLPSLVGFAQEGWDPHQGRMVATWLDPNFFGVFLVMILPYAIHLYPLSPDRESLPVRQAGVRVRGILKVCICIWILTAIILTQSRSAVLAMLVATACSVPLFFLSARISAYAKRILGAAAILALVCTALMGFLLGDRATSVLLHDPTTTIRIDAYKSVWRNLVEPNTILGVGYNAYQFAAKNAGIIGDFSIHSRAGSDSSILTLLVTTGVVGTAFFFIPIIAGVSLHLWRFLHTRNFLSLCFLFATVTLLVHSQVTNSLLYPHVLMTYILLAAISFSYD